MVYLREFVMLNCSVNRREVIVESTNVGWQIILNAFCAIDSFFFIGYAVAHVLYFAGVCHLC